MGLEEVLSEIDATAKAQSDAVQEQARQEGEKMLSEATEKSGALYREKMAEAERSCAALALREAAGAELEIKRARLIMEKEMLEMAAIKARERIGALSVSEDEALLDGLLRRHKSPGYRVHCAKKNELYVRAKTGLDFGTTIQCMGGILLESHDRTVRMDFTYDTILREVVERSLRQLHGQLFPR